MLNYCSYNTHILIIYHELLLFNNKNPECDMSIHCIKAWTWSEIPGDFPYIVGLEGTKEQRLSFVN